VAALALAGCGSGDTKHTELPAAPTTLQVHSSAIPAGGRIPTRFTCAGAGVSPPVAWSGTPPGTAAMVIVVRDRDAARGNFQHWARWDLQPGGTLREDAPPDPRHEGRNDFGAVGWGPPCPRPKRKPHTYVFTVYALERPMRADPRADPDVVTKAIAAAKPLARGEFRATFGR
jgi:Raf kinase inhibitor-like YbhB/YbcL family protein